MISRKRQVRQARGILRSAAAGALLMGAGAAARGADHPIMLSQAEVDRQYQQVLAEMKHPTGTGILVTEIEPESPAGMAGLQAGDIIYHYGLKEVRTLDALRQEIAEAFASNLAENNENKILLGVSRRGKEVVLQIPRAPLGIRAIEVQAAVAVRPNPLPSPRGSIAMKWDGLTQSEPGNAEAFFRTNAGTLSGTWTGWERETYSPGADAVTGQADTYRVDGATGAVLSSQLVSFRIRTGDYVTSPAFVLDSFEATDHTPEGATVSTRAQRAGLKLRTQISTAFADRVFTPIKRDIDSPLDAIPQAAVELVAAAMPQEKGAAIALSVLSIRDFLSRPGYLLIARGKEAVPSDKSGGTRAWRVDLMHCGMAVESYWITDQRKVFEKDVSSGTELVTRRVGSMREASAPVKAMSATQPATQASTRLTTQPAAR